jgi:cell division septum initiation protein DivIVA
MHSLKAIVVGLAAASIVTTASATVVLHRGGKTVVVDGRAARRHEEAARALRKEAARLESQVLSAERYERPRMLDRARGLRAAAERHEERAIQWRRGGDSSQGPARMQDF